MAHLFVHDGAGWAVALLEGSAFAFAPGSLPPLRRAAPPAPEAADGPPPAALLLRVPGDEDSWLLVAAPAAALRVNGRPLSAAAGARVLKDRDEIAVAASPRVFFSTERLPQVERFPGSRPVPCARCRKPIEPGRSLAVRCPRCGVWHHEEGKLLCWSYGPECAGGCDLAVAESSHFRFTPEGAP